MIKKKHRSGIAASIYEMVEGLYEAGLMNKQTKSEFDELDTSTDEKFWENAKLVFPKTKDTEN
ncbi:MAG: hypothetical protein PHU14_12505 [Methylovulum sp.]|nr:hypothetical protein [Methylovulum sp.]